MARHPALLLLPLLLAACGRNEADVASDLPFMDRPLPDDLLAFLAERGESEELQSAFLGRVAVYGNLGIDAGAVKRELEVLDGILRKHDLLSLDYMKPEAAVTAVTRHGFLPAREWVADYDTNPDVTRTLTDRLQRIANGFDPPSGEAVDRILAEITERKAAPDKGEAAAVMRAWIVTGSAGAASMIEAGLRGTPGFGGSSTSPPLVFASCLEQLSVQGGPESDAAWARLEEGMRKWTPPESAATLDTLIALHAKTGDDRAAGLARSVSKDPSAWVRARGGALGKDVDREGANRLLAALGLKPLTAEEFESVPRKPLDSATAAEYVNVMLGADGDLAEATAVTWIKLDARGLAKQVNALLAEGKKVHPKAVDQAFGKLEKVSGRDVDEFYMRSLAGFGEERAKAAVRILQARLDAETFPPAFFDFMVRKGRFRTSEVLAYKLALGSYRGVGPVVVREVEQRLQKVGGDPEKLYWMIKVLSIAALAAQGDAAAKPVLRKLAADPSHYMLSDIRRDPNTGKEILTNTKKIFYRKEIEKALAAIDAREAKKKR